LNVAPAAPSSPTPSPTPKASAGSRRKSRAGRRLPCHLGRYTLFERIGWGGMANIYLARARTELGAHRLCVIKEVLPELADDGRFAEMLAAEARLASRLNHANVAKVEDLGREDGTLYIAMEYVEGFDLRELLRRAATQKVAFPIAFSLLVVTEVLRGLDYAHRLRDDEGKPLGIVHRDVSPSNVLVSLEGEVKLCDFGIARANATLLDEDATIQGKAGYMSPEQARGEALDARSDVFAAGIILWELLAGRRLYKAPPGEALLAMARNAEVPPLPRRDLPDEEALAAIVARALAPSREDRYPTAGAMLRDLERWAAGARMMPSPLRFGAWLTEQFGKELLTDRRSRQRAIEALERGPAAILTPLTPEAAPASVKRSNTPTPPPAATQRPGEKRNIAAAKAAEEETVVEAKETKAPVKSGHAKPSETTRKRTASLVEKRRRLLEAQGASAALALPSGGVEVQSQGRPIAILMLAATMVAVLVMLAMNNPPF
jgi:serine/threonine-protein kinase